jgi:hypothetical protein
MTKKKLRSKMKFGVGNCLSLMRVKLNVVIPWGGFVLRDNQFSGEIPHGINDWKKLNVFDLGNNRFCC